MYGPVYSAEHSALFFAAEPRSSGNVFSGERNVFVCGALQDPVRMSSLLGQEPSFASAAVTGYRRSVERIDEEDIPFMVPDEHDPRNVLTGVVWLDLTQGSLERIESLELERGLRKRITVDARIGELSLDVFTYIRR